MRLTILIFIVLIGLSFFAGFKTQETIARRRKANQLESQKTFVEVEPDSSFPWNGLGIFIELNQTKDSVHLVFPFLDETGELKYHFQWYDLLQVKIHPFHQQENKDTNVWLIQQISSFVQQQLKIQQEISEQEKEKRQIEHLLTLVAASQLYGDRKGIYERALAQVEQIVEKGKKLEQIYTSLIRELLIGRQLSEYDPNRISNKHLALDNQYQQIKEEYESLKDQSTAYTELMKRNKR